MSSKLTDSVYFHATGYVLTIANSFGGSNLSSKPDDIQEEKKIIKMNEPGEKNERRKKKASGSTGMGSWGKLTGCDGGFFLIRSFI